MITFKKEHSNFARIKQEPEETITVTTSSEGLFEVIAAFERFLQGCGYVLNGHLDFVDEFTSEVPPSLQQPFDSIYEDGGESPSNGAQSDWPFPTAKRP